MYLALIGVGGLTWYQGVPLTYTNFNFPPILATQELTTTPNWPTKTNLGSGRPVSKFTELYANLALVQFPTHFSLF